MWQGCVPIHEIAAQVGDTVETVVASYVKPREASAANIARAYAVSVVVEAPVEAPGASG